jgi:hypothetical protein
MKCAAVLNVSPPSLTKMQELTPTCTIKNVIKKRPVRPIINFLPIEEVKKCFQVILKELGVDLGYKNTTARGKNHLN